LLRPPSYSVTQKDTEKEKIMKTNQPKINKSLLAALVTALIFVLGACGQQPQTPAELEVEAITINARAHTVAVKEALRLRSKIRAKTVFNSTNGLDLVDEYLTAMLKVPALNQNARTTIGYVLPQWPSVENTLRNNKDFHAISRQMHDIFMSTGSITEIIAKLEVLKTTPEVKNLPGALTGMNYAIAILKDGASTIYNPNSTLWQSQPEAQNSSDAIHVVVVIGWSDAAGAVGGAVTGAAAGGLGAGPGAFVGAVATSAGAVLEDAAQGAIENAIEEVIAGPGSEGGVPTDPGGEDGGDGEGDGDGEGGGEGGGDGEGGDGGGIPLD
jgi:hypothetical protein